MKVFIADGAFGGDRVLAFSLSEEVHQRRRGQVHLMSLDAIVDRPLFCSFDTILQLVVLGDEALYL